MSERDKRYELPGLEVIFSDVHDGSMAEGGGKPLRDEHRLAAESFFERHDVLYDNATHIYASYGPEHTYTDIVRADSELMGTRFSADAIFTTDYDHPLTLTVADCVATVVYDPAACMVAMLHLGRHSSVAGLIEVFAIRVADELGSDPRDWRVWMSPSLQKDSNALQYFEPPEPAEWKKWQRHTKKHGIRIDIPGHNRTRFERLGVEPENIYSSSTDTYTNHNYFSHRAATEGDQPERQGRMMAVAVMRPT